MAVLNARDDPFWVEPTETDSGYVANIDESDETFYRCQYRLATELTELYYEAAGLAPRPPAGSADVLPLAAVDCEVGFRSFGRLDGDEFADQPPNLRWPGLIEWVVESLDLEKLADEDGHEKCRHRAGSFRTVWKAVLAWRAPSFFASGRELVAQDDGLVLRVEGRQRCRILPDGVAVVVGRELDLAAMAAGGIELAGLAHAIDELITGRPFEPAERLAGLVRRALCAAVPSNRLSLPDGVHCLSGKSGLIIVADPGVPMPAGVVEQAVQAAHQEDRRLHLMVPQGARLPAVDATVWTHDGYRAVRRSPRR